MKILLLCFQLFWMENQPIKEKPSEAQNDLNFVIAVERSIWLGTNHHYLESYVGQRKARLIRLLGSNDYLAREEASYQLKLMGESAKIPLIYGVWHEDIEVQHRSMMILQAMYFCHECYGDGKCLNCKYGCYDCNYNRQCKFCNGSGKTQ